MKKVLFIAASIATAALMSTAASAQSTCATSDGVRCNQQVLDRATTYNRNNLGTEYEPWNAAVEPLAADGALYVPPAGSRIVVNADGTVQVNIGAAPAKLYDYVGHGRRGGFIAANSRMVTADGRFNLRMSDGRYLLIVCNTYGGPGSGYIPNTELVGATIDCSAAGRYNGDSVGHPAGAIVSNSWAQRNPFPLARR